MHSFHRNVGGPFLKSPPAPPLSWASPLLHPQVDPFDPNSPIKRSAISSFPPDMFFVLRVVQLLRGLANGGVPEDACGGPEAQSLTSRCSTKRLHACNNVPNRHGVVHPGVFLYARMIVLPPSRPHGPSLSVPPASRHGRHGLQQRPPVGVLRA